MTSHGEYSVVQFFPDGSYEKVREFVGAEEAVVASRHYCTSIGARLGTTRRVIITDGGDCTVFEWKWAEGITFGASADRIGKFKKGIVS
jgi:hypothetical protein